MSNAKAVGAIVRREVFVNNGSTFTGRGRFVGWGYLPVEFRMEDEEEIKECDFWVYSFDTPIAWHFKAEDEWEIPHVEITRATTVHQKFVAQAVGQ